MKVLFFEINLKIGYILMFSIMQHKDLKYIMLSDYLRFITKQKRYT